MAQFDVHRTPGRRQASVPYVVVVQSRYHDGVPTRLVAPLLAAAPVADLRPPAHLPRFVIDGQHVIMDPLQMQSVPRGVLGRAVASPADDESAIRVVEAFDAVITRVHG